ncbi:MAG: ThiF family adenylyltransferase [Sedimenticola selenatireducens]|uniref:ThiF family adenylyltransferase n=1 Tax=Sedimenticola selenatireducens TaxID=191960 RepID=A0A557RWZ7_9GAMM|nr:ThiF family adenylyltransferase [Sedimenticola selenatireducens]TVO69696.1 ThiF family adenylyltransferase [Sedimenticola selenatireducens]TVT62236.1 MAG: ThiF family adenylyltransferase [Sedimenticola selenatireducens]
MRPRQPACWSSHQYGVGGDLCLELGPDNWHRDQNTAADMLVSAHRLLADEEARRTEGATVIPSRHSVTQGQEQRGKYVRFIITPAALAELGGVKDGDWAIAHFRQIYHNEASIVFLFKLEIQGNGPLVFSEVPEELSRHGFSVIGLVKGGNQEAALTDALSNAEALASYLDGETLPILDGESDPLCETRVDFVLMRSADSSWQLTMRWGSRQKLWLCSTVIAETSPASVRLGPDSAELSDTTVAIVGLGSVGSKIATSLARSGVNRFVLIDDDLLQPDNLVRNDSDWRHVGQHKVDAVADRLALVNSKIEVYRHRVRLAGQESATTAASATAAMGNASVIIDATANADAFNLCAHIARQSRRPLVWLEIYAGGIGGLIARARPDRDPEPFTLRQAINDAAGRIAKEKNAISPETGANYAIERSNQSPIIATDAEVSTIAHLACQLVADTLLEREPSRFPNPAYLVGLQRQWIFDQPLQVFPIDSHDIGSWTSDSPMDSSTHAAGLDFVKQLFEDLVSRGKTDTAS